MQCIKLCGQAKISWMKYVKDHINQNVLGAALSHSGKACIYDYNDL